LSRGEPDEFRGAEGLSTYDDLMRLLAFQGVFDGQVLYPLAGADYLPARWGTVRAVNWDDHRGLYRRMAKSLGRPDLSRPLNASWRTVGNVFDPRALSKALPPPPASGPRTLLLKHADGYREDERLAQAARGVFDSADLSGVLDYKSWLKFVFAEILRAGDYVVLLSRDQAARRELESSGRFSRVETGAPDLERMPAAQRAIIHLDGQALYAPNGLAVYRKKARRR
jgi:hypothetical protein